MTNTTATTAQLLDPEFYDTPDKVTEPKSLTVSASALKVGDSIRTRTNGHKRIAEVKVGPKRVTALDNAGKEILYVLRDEDVDVLRDEPTQEYLDAAVEARSKRTFAGKYQMVQIHLQGALNGVTGDIDEYGYADHWKMERLMAAQAEIRVWAEVAKAVESTGDLLEAVAYCRDRFASQMVSSMAYRTSRSTNQVSNLIEDIENEAKAKFVQFATDRLS